MITAAICTRNRAGMLPAALECLARQTLDRDAYEILVVDNGSTDSTAAVLADHAKMIANLRSVSERRVGLSWARNRAVAEARGQIIAFTDDDVRVSPGWLCAIQAGFDGNPRAVAAGGPVHPVYEVPPPEWMTPELAALHAAVDFGEAPRVLTLPDHPVGANMAFCAQVLRSLGGFTPRLGFSGRRLVGCEEVHMFARVSASGGVTLWLPAAAVDHMVPAARLSRRWAVHRQYGEGVARGRLTHGPGAVLPEWDLGVRYPLWRVIGENKLTALRRTITERRLDPLLLEAAAMAFHAGYLRGALGWTGKAGR